MASSPRETAGRIDTVIVTAGEAMPPWADALGAPVTLVTTDDAGTLARAVQEAGAILIDADVEAPLAVARRLRRLAPEHQVILVAAPESLTELKQTMLFTPGLGEPWLVAPADVDADLVERAAGIARKRRAHATQLESMAGRIEQLTSPSAQFRRLSDQYLATLLELLPEPVLALDEHHSILFANPTARRAFGVEADPPPGHDVRDALRPLDPDRLNALLAVGEPQPARGQLRLRHEDGSERSYSAVVAPVRSERPVVALVLHDVTEQVRARDALEEQAAELAASTEEAARQAERTRELAAERTAVLGNIADGVIIADGDGRISFMNAAAARIHGAKHLGIASAEWSSAYNLLTLDGEPYPPGELPLARALQGTEAIRDAEWLIERPDGTRVHAQGSAAPVMAADGQTMGAVLTLRDVTEQRRREAERERLLDERDAALAELKDVMRSRSRFYASMSHELRTPINAIIGYTELLTEQVYGEIPDEQRAALDRIGRSARHLLDLVNDVLDLSKIEAGKLTIEVEPTQIQPLIEDLEATMSPLASSHDVELRFDMDASCGRPIHTDPRRLRQILMNLLSNAIRYGAGEPVDVRCARSGGWVRISIEDRGPGIDAESLEAIFDEFVQLEHMDRGGTGLGLAIARTLAQSLGGDVLVESEPGSGSTFTIQLPGSRGTTNYK
jgi:PAS domain S-box-containing protein